MRSHEAFEPYLRVGADDASAASGVEGDIAPQSRGKSRSLKNLQAGSPGRLRAIRLENCDRDTADAFSTSHSR
ncbi:protein of unknown function [Candidatus Filomicrobium marinum]|nr:protein of unknown function [Candidatus Filomicrobium marinum]